MIDFVPPIRLKRFMMRKNQSKVPFSLIRTKTTYFKIEHTVNQSQPSQVAQVLSVKTVVELEAESETWSSLNTPPKLYTSSQHIASNEVLEILKLKLRLQYTSRLFGNLPNLVVLPTQKNKLPTIYVLPRGPKNW